MNKRLDLTKNGGFPATQHTLAFMQDSYRLAFMALASMIGDKIIVMGCDVVGGTVTDGWISVGGELMPFKGGLLQAESKVIITEATAERIFDDGVQNTVYFEKIARLGSPGAFAFTDLIRIGTISGHISNKQNPHETTLAQLGFSTSGDINSNDAAVLATTALTNQLLGLNKIAGYGLVNFGDIGGGDVVKQVNHNLNIAGNYIVIGCLKSNQAALHYRDNKVTWTWFNPQANSFQVSLQENASEVQDVSFSWLIIKL